MGTEMTLLTAHKILIVAALTLSVVLLVWGVVHGAARHESFAWPVAAVGALGIPLTAVYLRKLKRNPPIR